jgi:hypothetical protein
MHHPTSCSCCHNTAIGTSHMPVIESALYSFQCCNANTRWVVACLGRKPVWAGTRNPAASAHVADVRIMVYSLASNSTVFSL